MMFRLNNKVEIDEKAGAESGVYKIYWVKNHQSQVICRLCKNDKSGLLYIGQTEGALVNRLNEFRCSAFLNSSNHIAGKKYRQNETLKKLIRQEEIVAEIFPCNNPKKKETEMLLEYKNKYGEVPPLNG